MTSQHKQNRLPRLIALTLFTVWSYVVILATGKKIIQPKLSQLPGKPK